MEIYAAQYRFRRDYDFDFPISTLFWGAVIFVALVAACLLVGKAIPRLRNRKRLDRRSGGGRTHEGLPLCPNIGRNMELGRSD